MAPLLEGSLRLIADGVLARSIQTLRQAQVVMQQTGASKDNPHLMMIEENLRQMEAEAERRGLNIPEEPPEAWES